jgi:purine-binding chemotaxis protein CheW
MNKYILFQVADATFGIPSGDVRHIEMVEHITIVPNANPAIDGVVFSRGQVIPALNLRARFGFPRAAHDLRTRLIFVQVKERVIGLIVDSAREFVSLADEAVKPIEQTLTGINGNFLKGVATVDKRLVLLIDLNAVLDVDRYVIDPAVLPDSSNVAELAAPGSSLK